ncbi:MAG: hypothetical protein GQ570_11210 [Helicobacteraceae bacterium]|nr:hypothetical protein [Helicobacteraceae bacterium]
MIGTMFNCGNKIYYNSHYCYFHLYSVLEFVDSSTTKVILHLDRFFGGIGSLMDSTILETFNINGNESDYYLFYKDYVRQKAYDVGELYKSELLSSSSDNYITNETSLISDIYKNSGFEFRFTGSLILSKFCNCEEIS